MEESKINFEEFQCYKDIMNKIDIGQKFYFSVIKRIIDIVLSLTGLTAALPLMIFFGFLVKLESNGPVIFAQKRIGYKGSIFTMYKLRSMHMNVEKETPTWTEVNDPRITKVGKFIRKTRIDELPQIFNILKGEMSIVGPRPEIPELTYQFEREIPGFLIRLSVKPGLTGWAQINGGYDVTPRKKIILDMEYILNRNILLDLLIIIKTFKVVVTGKGAR